MIQIAPSSTQQMLASSTISISSSSISINEEPNNYFSINISNSTTSSNIQSVDSQLIAYVISDSTTPASPMLQLVWRIRHPDSKIQYLGTSIPLSDKFPSDLSSILSFQFYIQNKPNTLTSINDINIHLIGINSSHQNSLFKIHIYSNTGFDLNDEDQENNNGENGENGDDEENRSINSLRYKDISSLITTIPNSSQEILSPSRLNSYFNSLNTKLPIKSRELPPFPRNLNARSLLCSHGRGIVGVLYKQQQIDDNVDKTYEQNLANGLAIYDVEEDEENDETENEGDEEEGGENNDGEEEQQEI